MSVRIHGMKQCAESSTRTTLADKWQSTALSVLTDVPTGFALPTPSNFVKWFKETFRKKKTLIYV